MITVPPCTADHRTWPWWCALKIKNARDRGTSLLSSPVPRADFPVNGFEMKCGIDSTIAWVVHMPKNVTSGEFKFTGRHAPSVSYDKFPNTWDTDLDRPMDLHVFDATVEVHGLMVLADSRPLAVIRAEAPPPVGALQGAPATPRGQASDAPDASEFQREKFWQNTQMHYPARCVRIDGNVSTTNSNQPDNKQTRAGQKVANATRTRVEAWMMVIRSSKLQKQMKEELPDLLEKILAWHKGCKAGGAATADVIAYRMCVLKDAALMEDMERTDPDGLDSIRAWYAAVKAGSVAGSAAGSAKGGAAAAEVLAYRMRVLNDPDLMEELVEEDPDHLDELIAWREGRSESTFKGHATKAKKLAAIQAAAVGVAHGGSADGGSGGEVSVDIAFTNGDRKHAFSGTYTRTAADRWKNAEDTSIEMTLLSTGHWEIQQLAESKGRQPFRSVAGPPKDTTLYGLGGMWDIAPEGGSRLAFGWLATVIAK